MPGDKNDNAITRNVIVTYIVIGILAILYFYYQTQYLPLSRFESIKAGMSIGEVYHKLGSPYKTTKKGKKLDTMNYHPVPKMKNRNLVLEYNDKWYRAYIFINENNKVFAVVISAW